MLLNHICIKEAVQELKKLLTDDFKKKDPETYYKLLEIVNKYFSYSPYEKDI